MSTNWHQLHGVFLANMTDGIYDWLAEQLGVTSASLRELQIGWAPSVLMKKGKYRRFNYFTIPQRDATGKVVGLALRDCTGGKCTYPGCGVGCVYPVNPKHRHGDHGYAPGAHNWVRTMDVKELCPVCQKPDGCLLSADDPTNPKAVICLRTKSDKAVGKGWLHILQDAVNFTDQALLAGTGAVVAVEGMSDVAAALSIGLTAVGRPGNMTGMDIVGEVARGRPLIVMGENDQKSNGDWPGRDGMVATFQTAKTHTFQASMLMPPPTIKDLRAWVVNNGLTLEAFNEYHEQHQVVKADGVMANNHPMTVAAAFLQDNYYVDRRYLLRRWMDSWYRYDAAAGRYVVVQDPEVRTDFYRWTVGKQAEVTTGKETKLEPLVANTAMWSNFYQAAEAHILLTGVNLLPAWVNGVKGPTPTDLVVFNNGILDVPAYLEGHDEHLLPTTPDFFNTTALPHAFNPSASCPAWLTFLSQSLGDEAAKIELLQEWLGYCLTPDTSRQKMMYFRGESGSGKGTILNVLQQLVGSSQHASSSLSQLAEPFGLQPLIGKLVCVIGDARVSRNMDAMRGLEVLLGITGNDAMQINRKFKDQLEGTILTARITIASNEFLDVPDHAGAMLRRLNVIQFSRSFRDNPDVTLPVRLAEEIAGIAAWALIGLKRLRDQGGFTVPASSVAALQEWERDTNPLIAWMQDCTEEAENVITSKQELYDCWTKWASETHRQQWTRSVFLRRLFGNASSLSDAGTGVKGINLQPSAARRYTGRP